MRAALPIRRARWASGASNPSFVRPRRFTWRKQCKRWLLQHDVTLENVYHLLTDIEYLKDVVAVLECRPEASAMVRHFQKFMAQPPEQLAGVMASAGNYLHHFTSPAIAEVFCRDSTFAL